MTDDLWMYGRCKSGKKWFWAATCCCFGEPTGYEPEHGWADTEAGAMAAAEAVIERQGGEPYLKHGHAYRELKRVNAEKRKACPPSGSAEAGVVEYLYDPWQWTNYDSYPYETHKGINEFPITRKTPKRIYYDNSSHYDQEEGIVTLGFIDRQEFEANGKIRRPGYSGWSSSGKFYATREAAEDWLYRAERQRQEQEAAPEVKRLRREMADVHPDRGGTNEQFIAARKRYEDALRKAS